MRSSDEELERPSATSVRVTDDTITVDLNDGRQISVPTNWYPRLVHATPQERANYEIDAVGISWPDIEADFSIRGLLLGRKSGENPRILKWWLQQRAKGRRVTFQDYMRERHKPVASTRKRTRKAS